MQDLYNAAYESGFESGYAEAERELEDVYARRHDDEFADLGAEILALKERLEEEKETSRILRAKLDALS